MKPPKLEMERVTLNDFIAGTIEMIQYDEKHFFKSSGKTGSAVRFKFNLFGYQYPKYSRWMTFSYNEKSNLYQKYIFPLIEGAKPNMDFDLDGLIGMEIKILWAEKNNFQYPETIRPLDQKLKPTILEIQSEGSEESMDPDQPVIP